MGEILKQLLVQQNKMTGIQLFYVFFLYFESVTSFDLQYYIYYISDSVTSRLGQNCDSN